MLGALQVGISSREINFFDAHFRVSWRSCFYAVYSIKTTA